MPPTFGVALPRSIKAIRTNPLVRLLAWMTLICDKLPLKPTITDSDWDLTAFRLILGWFKHVFSKVCVVNGVGGGACWGVACWGGTCWGWGLEGGIYVMKAL